MKFRTELKPIQNKFLINHKTKVLALGSCFAENIGEKLINECFNISINPFEILFNPQSILNLLTNKELNKNHLIKRNGIVVSLDLHSKYAEKTEVLILEKFKKDKKKLNNQLKDINILSLTFGTAWVYEFNDTKLPIANCQKQPANQFSKKILPASQMVNDYTVYLTELFNINKNLKLILTVSPVRHIKDGLVGNNLSKATLLLLCHQLKEKFPNQIIYYPSYEIQLDDLRDYRFYESDLIHPNQVAISYIYEHFKRTFMSNSTTRISELINKCEKLKNHRFISASKIDIENHQKTIGKFQSEINSLISQL